MAQLSLQGQISFDFGSAHHSKSLIENLSGVVVQNEWAWTVSDEGHTFECFKWKQDHFHLHRQFELSEFFPDLPEGEADLECIDLLGDRLWLCGSHSSVSVDSDGGQGLLKKPSRRLLGSVRISDDGGVVEGSAVGLPFTGEGSLRHLLKKNTRLRPSLELASKSGGLDIEGIAVFENEICFGLRGPLVDNCAVLAFLPLDGNLPDIAAEPHLVLLPLQGLGVRDLCRLDDRLIVLAGPMSALGGPFQIFEVALGGAAPSARLMYGWHQTSEHPEGLAAFTVGGAQKFLVLFDGPRPARVAGDVVHGDILA